MNIYEIIQTIERFYLSPFSKIYQDIRLCQRIAVSGNSPQMIRTADPQSWFNADVAMTKEESLLKLMDITRYLSAGNNVFDRSASIEMDRAFPYFEWTHNQMRFALSDFFGNYQIILKDSEHLNENLLEMYRNQNDQSQSYLFILNCEAIEESELYQNIYCLDIERDEYIEQLKPANHSRINLISYFSSSIEGVLIDPSGIVKKLLTKHDLNSAVLMELMS